LRLSTSKSGDELISLKEYVGRVKEGENDIYRITGESIAVVSSSQFLENLRMKGLEVLYMVTLWTMCNCSKYSTGKAEIDHQG